MSTSYAITAFFATLLKNSRWLGGVLRPQYWDPPLPVQAFYSPSPTVPLPFTKTIVGLPDSPAAPHTNLAMLALVGLMLQSIPMSILLVTWSRGSIRAFTGRILAKVMHVVKGVLLLTLLFIVVCFVLALHNIARRSFYTMYIWSVLYRAFETTAVVALMWQIVDHYIPKPSGQEQVGRRLTREEFRQATAELDALVDAMQAAGSSAGLAPLSIAPPTAIIPSPSIAASQSALPPLPIASSPTTAASLSIAGSPAVTPSPDILPSLANNAMESSFDVADHIPEASPIESSADLKSTGDRSQATHAQAIGPMEVLSSIGFSGPLSSRLPQDVPLPWSSSADRLQSLALPALGGLGFLDGALAMSPAVSESLRSSISSSSSFQRVISGPSGRQGGYFRAAYTGTSSQTAPSSSIMLPSQIPPCIDSHSLAGELSRAPARPFRTARSGIRSRVVISSSSSSASSVELPRRQASERSLPLVDVRQLPPESSGSASASVGLNAGGNLTNPPVHDLWVPLDQNVEYSIGQSSPEQDWSRLLGLQSLGSSLNLPRPDELFLLDCPLPCLTPEDWEEKENRNESAAFSQVPRPAMPALTIPDPVEESQDRNVAAESTQRLPAAERCYWMVASRNLRRKYGIPLAATLPDGVPLPPIKDHNRPATLVTSDSQRLDSSNVTMPSPRLDQSQIIDTSLPSTQFAGNETFASFASEEAAIAKARLKGKSPLAHNSQFAVPPYPSETNIAAISQWVKSRRGSDASSVVYAGDAHSKFLVRAFRLHQEMWSAAHPSARKRALEYSEMVSSLGWSREREVPSQSLYIPDSYSSNLPPDVLARLRQKDRLVNPEDLLSSPSLVRGRSVYREDQEDQSLAYSGMVSPLELSREHSGSDRPSIVEPWLSDSNILGGLSDGPMRPPKNVEGAPDLRPVEESHNTCDSDAEAPLSPHVRRPWARIIRPPTPPRPSPRRQHSGSSILGDLSAGPKRQPEEADSVPDSRPVESHSQDSRCICDGDAEDASPLQITRPWARFVRPPTPPRSSSRDNSKRRPEVTAMFEIPSLD